MGVLVVDDVRLVAAVALQERVGVVARVLEEVHLHDRGRAVRRRAHVGVVDATTVRPAGEAASARVGPVVGLGLYGVAVDRVEVAAARVNPMGACRRWSWNLLT